MVIIEAWVKAFEHFQKELVALSEKGETITSLEQFAIVWTNLAEDAFSEVFYSEKYIRAQGKLITATMKQRIQQRQMVEMVCKQLDIPTRSEVDLIHRTNYELRKELKALKKKQGTGAALATLQQELADLKATVAKLSAKPKRTTPKKPSPEGSQEEA